MNRADLARGWGIHQSTVGRYSRELGLVFEYNTSRTLEPDEIAALNEYMALKGKCSYCGETSHSAKTCPNTSELKRCKDCSVLKS
ncbi:MAG: hypothetical protein JRN02_07380, partial [Nitrososphaerota archaeon]|nr:hypothetical protein [Nitrososphaerota archaeon]